MTYIVTGPVFGGHFGLVVPYVFALGKKKKSLCMFSGVTYSSSIRANYFVSLYLLSHWTEQVLALSYDLSVYVISL